MGWIKSITKKPTTAVLLVGAVITLIGVFVKGAFDLRATAMPIQATQTAEAKLTEIALSHTPISSTQVPTIIVTLSPTENQNVTFATPTIQKTTQSVSVTPSPSQTNTPTPSKIVDEITNDNFAEYSVGDHPSSLLFDRESIWVALSGNNSVMRLSPNGEILNEYLVGNKPVDIAFDGENIWVLVKHTTAFSSKGGIIKLSRDGQVLFIEELGDTDPISIKISDQKVWIVARTYYGNGKVLVYHLNGTYNRSYYDMGPSPWDIVFIDNTFWLALRGNSSLVQMDFDGNVMNQILLDSPTTALTYDGEHIWTITKDLWKISPTGEIAGRFTLKSEPYEILEYHNGYIWVGSKDDDTITKLDKNGNTLAQYNVGRWPTVITFDQSSMWVANSWDDTLTKIPIGDE